MKIFAYILLSLLVSGVSYGQAPTPPNLIPPSPTAYSLGVYGDIPVSLYTGVPGISVPVYTLKDHTAAVDISVSYHASGIKVDETASYVGLGWALNAGGVITRTVRARAETLLTGDVPSPGRADIKFYSEFSPPITIAALIASNNLQEAANGGLDTEPDEFYYNFGGKAGKFSFDKNNHPRLEKQDGLEIQWKYIPAVPPAPFSYDTEFIIKDESGTTYEFISNEKTYYNLTDQDAISAWYLNKITSPTGNVITFEYNNPVPNEQYIRAYTEEFVTMPNSGNGLITTPTVQYTNTWSTPERSLSKIKSNNGTVEFSYQEAGRKDYPALSGVHALDEIIIRAPDNSVLKRYKFSTSYFVANDDHKYNGPDTADFNHLNYHLRLDSVRVLSSSGVAMQPAYSFTYLGDNDPGTSDAYTLPYRLSSAQDNWGYYNQTLNTHLLPGKDNSFAVTTSPWYTQFMIGAVGYTTSQGLTGGANRNPDTAAMKAGMISKMYYPTGGYSEFFFEPNTNNFGGLRIKQIVDHPITGIPKETDYSYTSNVTSPDLNKYYFEAYQVAYAGNAEPTPSAPELVGFGVPIESYTLRILHYLKVSAQPQAILGLGSRIGYATVTTKQPGNGWTISHFDDADSTAYPDYTDSVNVAENKLSPPQLPYIFHGEYLSVTPGIPAPIQFKIEKPGSSYLWPYPNVYSNSWKRGTLNLQSTYTESGTLIRNEYHTYYRQLLDTIPGYKLIQFVANSQYVYARYYLPNGWNKLKSDSVITYDLAGHNPVTSYTQYYYDNLAHQQPTRIITNRSDGAIQVAVNTYALDYTYSTAPGFIQQMQNNHLLAYPIEQVKYKSVSDTLKSPSGVLTYYHTSTGLPDSVSTLKNTKDFNTVPFKFSNRAAAFVPPPDVPGTFMPDNRYEHRLSFVKYDTLGNLRQVNRQNHPDTVYVWSYNGNYPIAKIQFATYADVDTALGGEAAVAAFRDSLPTDAEVRAFLAPLRTAAFRNSLVTTYTYKPLVGMTSITDPKGEPTYYEYDGFNRLMNVKDRNGNITKHTEYHYQNQ